MNQTMGLLDRTVRIIIAVVLAALYYRHLSSVTISIIPLVIAGILVLISMVSFCPLYRLPGMSTCAVKKEIKKQ